jgi:glucan phosphoethanolaminetransferase (alkaline phosphatase superfamily)
MSKINTYSNKGFKSGIVLLVLFFSLILFWFFSFIAFEIFFTIRRILIVIIMIVVIIGIVYSLKGIREPNTLKKIIGLVLNFGLGSICIWGFILNAIAYFEYIAK